MATASLPSLLLPKEHGSWSLALEPVALGWLVAPGEAGAACVAACVAGFLARRPWKLAVTLAATDPRRGPARALAAALAALALAALALSAVLGRAAALWPLVLAVPPGALFLWFDWRQDAREAGAELAGAATFGWMPAVVASLAGWPAPAALALASLALGRSLPTVLAVRSYLRAAKGQPAAPAAARLAAVAATGTVGALAVQGAVPWIAGWLSLLLLARTLWLVSPLRPAWPARRLGLMEAGIGWAHLGGLALAYHWA